ncbi:660_t:CDS:2 [Cetraspora pellucida]|uniref:660_t:CDS:1 n=1 Tax=Cetraspora pellucida TaxID=1433469 RepID=A0A9N8Z5W0_9GLOM|nr:660_t:CDS:2 [Cetraspora pellucida]
MPFTRNVATQTIPVHTVERSSTMCLTPNCLTAANIHTEQFHFSMLKVTCIQQIEYTVQLLPTIDKLSEEDLMKMDVVLPEGKLNGRLFNLNTKNENIILRRLCRPEIWKQFGFSHIKPETTSKHRQFNKQYCLYASGYQCSPPLITIDHVNQPFGSLSQLTFMLNWITDVTHVTLLRQRLTNKQWSTLSLEIAAIDLAFRSLMKNLLLQRYPLVFSSGYHDVSEKLQYITRCIPLISKSLMRIIQNSQNENFRSKATEFAQRTRAHTNLSFIPNGRIKYDVDSTPEQMRKIFSNGLYSIARDIKVHIPAFQEYSSSDEETLNTKVVKKSKIISKLNRNKSNSDNVFEDLFDSYGINNYGEAKDIQPVYLECDTDNNDDIDLFASDITSDVDDYTGSLFDADDEDNRDFGETVFEEPSGSDTDNFLQEDLHYLDNENRSNFSVFDQCNNADFSDSKITDVKDARVVPDDDVELLNFDEFEDKHFFVNTRDTLELSHTSDFCVTNNKIVSTSQIQCANLHCFSDEQHNNSEDVFFDIMFEE